MRRTLAALAATTLLSAVLSVVSSAAPAAAVANGLATTPPMGFNDWNSFGCNVNEQLIKDTADLFVTSGLKAAGYTYVNIDDCWMTADRDADGHLVADPVKFPNGIKAVADYVHSKGLKLGIYESAGTTTCQRYAGSLGHETTDAQDFADWGVDYLKYDNCGAPSTDDTAEEYAARYQVMADALVATGRPIVYSVCEWGSYQPWNWAGEFSNLWRTTGDISDSYASMLSIVKQNAVLASYASPGAWNDPDMLEIGNGGMTDTEYRTHFSLWAEMAAPLLIGTDLREASAETMAILKNTDVIAVDQDPLGKQGTIVSNDGTRYVFTKPLSDGSVSVALFNAGSTATTISTTATAVGLPRRSDYALKDLWSKATTESTGTISAYVPAHGTVMYRVTPSSKPVSAAPSTVLSINGPAAVNTGSRSTVTVSVRNNGRTPVEVDDVRLTAPAGWSVRQLSRPGHRVIGAGQTTSATFSVGAPDKGAALSSATLTGRAALRTVGGRSSPTAGFDLTLVSPVQSPYKTANTTKTSAQYGQSGSNLAILAAGAGVGPASSSPFGSSAAADEYGAVYRSGRFVTGSTATATVSTVSSDRSATAGLMVRNKMTGGGTPVGVALSINGSGQVSMAYATDGGTAYTTSIGGGFMAPSVGLPVQLKLVRDGTTYTGSYSTDGTTWTTVGSATVAAAAAANAQDVGVFATSGNADAAAQAGFTNLVTP